MKTNYIIIVLGIVIGSSVIFALSQSVLHEPTTSKHCDIPFDENFIESRRITTGPNDGKPHYSIEDEFSIFYTIPIGEFRVDDNTYSLILKPVPTSDGYIIMCDPLPVLEKRFETNLESLAILIDGVEIPYEIENNALRVDVKNNTRVEIVGFSKISTENEQTLDDVFTEPMKNAIFYEGDGHYDYLPVNHNPNMMAMEKITLLDDDSIDIEFGQNNYEWSTGYKPIPEFEYTANFKVNDTFTVLCTNIGKDGYAEFHPDLSEPYLPGLGIVKYLGSIAIENEPILLFWHESATIPVDMSCSYPEIISYSINLWQLEEHGLPTDSLENALGSNYKT